MSEVKHRGSCASLSAMAVMPCDCDYDGRVAAYRRGVEECVAAVEELKMGPPIGAPASFGSGWNECQENAIAALRALKERGPG